MVEVRTRETTGEATCPLCREPLGGEVAPCRGCETRYHEACLAELGGCSTLGCSLQGVAVGTARRLGCGVCGQVAAEPLTRRRCGCGATVHQACVDAHATACERGRRLQGEVRDPPRTTRAPARTSKFVSLGLAVVLQVVAGVLWGLALTSHAASETFLLGGLIAYNVARAHAQWADLSWSDPDDRRALLATLALLVPGLGMAVWWRSRRDARQ